MTSTFSCSLVPVKPVLQPFAFPKVIQEGMKVVVTCSVADGDAPFEVFWLRNGRALPEDSVRVQKYTDDFATLTIEKASPRHNGDYTCAAKNGVAEVNYTSTLTVHGEYYLPTYLACSLSTEWTYADVHAEGRGTGQPSLDRPWGTQSNHMDSFD